MAAQGASNNAIRRLHVGVMTSAHPRDDVRVREKFVGSLLEGGSRVSWVGPDYSYFNAPDRRRGEVEWHLFPRRPGRLGRLLANWDLQQAAARLAGVDVLYVPDPDALIPAFATARKTRAKVVFDVHESYDLRTMEHWGPKGLRTMAAPFLDWAMEALARRADLVLGVNAEVLKFLRGRTPNTLVVRSCAPAWFAGEPAAEVMGPTKRVFRVMHGKADFSRGTRMVLEAAARLRKEMPELRVVLVDFFQSHPNQELVSLIARLGLSETVEVVSKVPMREMPKLLSACDCGIIAYGRSLGLASLPNRIFEFMAAGLPVIVPEYARQMVAIVEQEKCGITADFENPESIAKAVRRMADDAEMARQFGRNAREAFLLRHNWDVEFQPFLKQLHLWNARDPNRVSSQCAPS